MAENNSLPIVPVDVVDVTALGTEPKTPSHIADSQNADTKRSRTALASIMLFFIAVLGLLWLNLPEGSDDTKDTEDTTAPLAQSTNSAASIDDVDSANGGEELDHGDKEPNDPTDIVVSSLAHDNVVLFDGVLVTLAEPFALAAAPPLLQSTDGINWTPIATSATVDGEATTSLRRWRLLDVAGAGISLVTGEGAFDRLTERAQFISTNRSDWVSATHEVQPVDPFQSFTTVSVTEDSLVGDISLERGPADLNIAEDIAPDVVRVCLADLDANFFGPDVVVANFDRDRSELDRIALRDADVLDALALGDGRVVGVGERRAGSLPETCVGVIELAPSASQFLYVLDPARKSVSEWPLPPALVGADNFHIIGEVATGPLRRLVVGTFDGLWTFDAASEQWGSLGPGPGNGASTMMSSSSSHLYSIKGATLQRWSFAQVNSDAGIPVCSWVLPEDEAAPDSDERVIVFASDEHVGYETASVTWLIDTTSLRPELGVCTGQREEPIETSES